MSNWFIFEDALNNLSPLANLRKIYGTLWLKNNNSLTSLNGLDNIMDTIFNLYIEESPRLSFCSVESICNYLEAGGRHSILGNTSTCNSSQSILEQCAITSISSLNFREKIRTYPNPASEELTIELGEIQEVDFEFLNIFGQSITKGVIRRQKTIDLSNESSGTYILRLYQDDKSASLLIVKN